MLKLSEIVMKFINAGIIGDDILDGTYMSPFIHLYKSGDMEAINKTIVFETALIHSLGSPDCKLRVSLQQLFDLKKDKAEDDMSRYMESPYFKFLVKMGIFKPNGDSGVAIDYPQGSLSATSLSIFTAAVELLNFVVMYQTGKDFTESLNSKDAAPVLTDHSPAPQPEESGIQPIVRTAMEEFQNPSRPPIRITRESAKISEEMDRRATHLLPKHARLS